MDRAYRSTSVMGNVWMACFGLNQTSQTAERGRFVAENPELEQRSPGAECRKPSRMGTSFYA